MAMSVRGTVSLTFALLTLICGVHAGEAWTGAEDEHGASGPVFQQVLKARRVAAARPTPCPRVRTCGWQIAVPHATRPESRLHSGTCQTLFALHVLLTT